MILLKTLHPNRWFLYFIAIAFIILLGVYYAAQTYLIEEDTRYLDQPIGITDTTPAQPAGDVVDMSGWKTYRNEEYGFEFRYPADFSVEIKDPQREMIVGEPTHLFEMRVHRVGEAELGSEYRSRYHGYEIFIYPASKKQDIISADENKVGSYEIINAGIMRGRLYQLESELIGPYYEGYVMGGSYIFSLSTYNPEDSLQQILSTFTFFEPKK